MLTFLTQKLTIDKVTVILLVFYVAIFYEFIFKGLLVTFYIINTIIEKYLIFLLNSS